MNSVWSIDNIHLGINLLQNDMLSDNFNADSISSLWLFTPGGRKDAFCENNIGLEVLF